MKLATATEQDYKFIREAFNEALQGFEQGGLLFRSQRREIA